MAKGTEYLIGGVLCLIIAIVSYLFFNRINAASFVAIIFFIYGVYMALKERG